MSSKTTWLAFVARTDSALPDPDAVLTTFGRHWPDVTPPELVSATAAMFVLRWAEASVAVNLIPRPIPAAQWQGPAAAAWYWPAAADAIAGHHTHLLLTLVDEGRDSIDKALRLTQLTAAVAADPKSSAVLWASSGTVHEPGAFREQAQASTPDDLPLYLWVDFRIEQDVDGCWRLFTTGLEAFERSELEVTEFSGEPSELLGWAYNAGHYQITNVSRLKDGDTLGMPDGRRLVARHETSILDGDKPVIRLECAAEG